MQGLRTDLHLITACFALYVVFIVRQCVGGDPIFFDFDENDDDIVPGRPARTANKSSDTRKSARKMLNNNSMALKHLSKYHHSTSTTTLSPLERPPDEDDDPPAPKPTASTTSRPTPAPELVHRTVATSLFQRMRTIVMSPGLARSLTQLAPASQQLFKTACLVKRSCTEPFVTGDSLTWILPDVSARARTRLWHQLICSLHTDHACPADGGWGAWGRWSDCGATCGAVGERVRRRLCDRPAPARGGLKCGGRAAQVQYCVSRGCGLDKLAGFMTERNPSQQLALQIVQKQVHAHPELEALCVREHCSYEHVRDVVGNGSLQAFWASLHCLKQAVACPMVGGWTGWSEFSECSAAPCGDGQQLRFRTCSDPAPSLPKARCRGKPFAARDCSVPCRPAAGGSAQWAAFGAWSACSADCGVGTQQRDRACRLVSLRRLDAAEAELEELDEAESMPYRRRRRRRFRRATYTGPKRIDLRLRPDKSGKRPRAKSPPLATAAPVSGVDPALCGGSSREVRVCRPECARDGEWTEWSGWSACSAACGPGVSTRDRLCGDPAPAGGGRLCTGVGSEVHYCFKRPCTVETRLLAAFNGSGYLIYRPLYVPSALLMVYVRFRPEAADSVLLHRFQNKCPEPRNCDWTKLTLVSGFLVLESTMRQCRVKLEGRPALELGRWHEAAVAIVGDRTFMRLDNAEEHRKAYLSCAPDGPNYDMDMYVGSDRNRRAAFRGTVSALAVNYMEYSLKMEADWTAGGVPAISESVATSVATADDVYVRLEAADFFTAQCPPNGTAARGERLDFVATFMIRRHGVLMFTRGIEEASFIFVKTGDVFHLCAQLAASKECLASSQNAELDTWYRLRVLIEPKVITMVVNFVHRTRLMRGLKFKVCRKIVYVGGGPPDTLRKIGESNGFQGLVESFLLNGRRDTSREMSVKEWGGMVSSAVASLADHYTEAVYQQGHAPALSCDYSDVPGAAAGDNASARARTRWLRLDELIDADSASVERSPPFSVLRLDPHSKDVQGFYACLVSTPSRTWLLHAFGVSFVRTTVVVPESLAEEWVAVMSAVIGCVLLLMAAGLLYVSKNRRFGLFPGVMRMIYGERLTEAEQLDYLQLQTGEFVRVTPSRRRLLRPSKQSLLLSRSRHALATPSRTVTLSPSREADFFLEPSKQVRFAHELQVTRSPSGRALTQTPSGAAVAVTGSGRVVTARALVGRDATLSPSGRITGYDVDVTTTEVTSDSGSDGSDDSGTPLLAGPDSPPAVLSPDPASTAVGSGSDSTSEGYPPPPGTADSFDSGDSEPFSP